MISFFFLIHPGIFRICVSSAQTFTRHAETVTTQRTLRRLWKMHWWAFGLIFVTSCPPRHARHPWQEFPPPTSVFLEVPEDKAWRNGQGSSGTVLRNQTELPARVSLWECCPVYLWENSVSPGLRKDAWLSFREKGGTLNPEKSEFLCLTGVLNTHTQSKRGSCAHPPRRQHHFFWAQRTCNLLSRKTTTIIKQKCRIQTFGFKNRRNKS